MECKHENPIIIISLFHVFELCLDCLTLFCDHKPLTKWVRRTDDAGRFSDYLRIDLEEKVMPKNQKPSKNWKKEYLEKCKKAHVKPSIDMLKVLE